MEIFRKILKLVFSFALLAGIVFLLFWGKENREIFLNKVQKAISFPLVSQTVSEKELPEQADSKEITYEWEYMGKKYVLKENFYVSTFNFYQQSPKAYKYQGDLPTNWENDYYAMFFMSAKGDDSIFKVADDIKALGDKNKLSDDQIVELVLSFVQKLIYDDAKASTILNGGKESINYPYETLFNQSGVCSDKSILAAKILRELGYGTAIFTYEAEKHMALGIKCPQEYSNNGSGYCYAETTSVGFRIGMIPDFDLNNRVITNQEMKPFSQTQTEQFNVKRLGEARIFQTTDGKSYNGISKTLALAREIDALKINIQNLSKDIVNYRKGIEGSQNDLQNLMEKMKKLKNSEEYEEYNKLVDKYNDMADDYRDSIKKYNSMISTYNQKVARYNSLLKSF